MDMQSKLFAFRLAEKQAAGRDDGKWKIRDGIASAQACSGPTAREQYVLITPFTDSAVKC
jgi:hypothetical protein